MFNPCKQAFIINTLNLKVKKRFINLHDISCSTQIHSWKASQRVLKTCHWTRKRQVFISDVGLNRHGMVLATEEGEGYLGYFTKKSETTPRKGKI